MLVTQISIDAAGTNRFEYVVAKQGDNGSRVIQITLINNGKIYILDNLTIARAFIKKPDKTEVLIDCPISNNVIELKLKSNILACAGTANVEILLTNNSTGDILTSAEFDLKIVASDTSEAESSTDYASLKDGLMKLDSVATKKEVEVLKARMDTFVALPEGSTTGDAELQDIRVGSDGTVYDSAGEAVRQQVSQLSEDVEALKEIIASTESTGGSLSTKRNEKPTADLLSTASIAYSGYTNSGHTTTYTYFCIPYSDDVKSATIRVKAPKFIWGNTTSGTTISYTPTEVETDESGYHDITMAESSYYKGIIIGFPNDVDVTKCYATYLADWVDVDLHDKDIEWLIKDELPILHENLYNPWDIMGQGSIGGTSAFSSSSYCSTNVTNYIPAKQGDCFWLYENMTANSNNKYSIGLFDAEYNYLGRMAYTNSEDCFKKFVISHPDTAYINATVDMTNSYLFKTNSDYEFDGDMSKVSSVYGVQFDANIEAKNQINNEPLNRFNGKTCLCLGDSITEENSSNGRTTWVRYISTWTGLKCTNGGISGSGLYKYGQSNESSVYHRLVNRADDDVFAEGTSYDYIILHGFMNDGSSKRDGQLTNGLNVGSPDDEAGTASVYGALKAVFDMLTEYYPLAKIGFVCSTPRWQTSSVTRDDPEGTDSTKCHGHGWFERYIEAYKYVCEEYNIPFLDLYHNSPFRGDREENVLKYFSINYEYDTTSYGGVVHPCPTGQKEGIAMPMFQWMKTYL